VGSPRTARMHPSTALVVAPADRVSPGWWPVSAVRRHDAPARIVLSDDEPQVPDESEEGGRRMPSRDCPNCDGSGYTTDAAGEAVICPVCDGTGSLFDDEDTSGAGSDAESG
jgi:hypothetical protein